MNEQEWTCRTELLLKKEGFSKLQNANVLVVGVGGVGGYAAEQLVRAGIGRITLVDSDEVHPSNKNRQVIALDSTMWKPKVEVMAQRMKDINPDIKVKTYNLFVEAANLPEVLEEGFDYVVDAIDSLTPKVDLLEACVKAGLPVVSSMGSGAKLDPSMVQVVEIEKTNHCKLAYMTRKYLHQRGVYKGIKAVFSPEPVYEDSLLVTDGRGYKRTTVGTISYMPAIFGCYCASVVIRDLLSR